MHPPSTAALLFHWMHFFQCGDESWDACCPLFCLARPRCVRASWLMSSAVCSAAAMDVCLVWDVLMWVSNWLLCGAMGSNLEMRVGGFYLCLRAIHPPSSSCTTVPFLLSSTLSLSLKAPVSIFSPCINLDAHLYPSWSFALSLGAFVFFCCLFPTVRERSHFNSSFLAIHLLPVTL